MASPSTICRKARWRGQGRRDVPWQSTGATPQQAGLPDQQETPCGTSGGTPKQLETPTIPYSCGHHWSYAGITDGGASPVCPVLCGWCCDEAPWPELDESAVRELAHKERFHSASICLVWLQSSLTCLQCYNLHR